MSSTLTDTVKGVGHKITEVAAKAVDFVTQELCLPQEDVNLGMGGIKPHMYVITSCGETLGVVERMQGQVIQLTKDGDRHFLPAAWIDYVDRHVYLNRSLEDVEACWGLDTVSYD